MTNRWFYLLAFLALLGVSACASGGGGKRSKEPGSKKKAASGKVDADFKLRGGFR